MHGANNYPLRKERSDLDIGLPDKANDQLFLSTLYDTLPRLIDKVEPDFIFYLSGVDILETDKLGRLSVSIEGCKQRDKFVFDQCLKNEIPVSVSMGGGYSPRIAHIIDAHANTFRLAQELFF
jgi:acetoin utilization deacetylase AcuC-like enzyme